MKFRASKTWKLRATPWTDVVKEVMARRLREASACFLLGEVDHGAAPGDADQVLDTQRAAESPARR